MQESSNYLEQTALDYDLPLEQVKEVYAKYRGVTFYMALEQILTNNRNQ